MHRIGGNSRLSADCWGRPHLLRRLGLGPTMDCWARVALSTLLLCSTSSFALPDDRNQIIELRAGSADINQQTHQGIYLHDVQLDQGSTHLRAHKAVTTGNDKNQLIVAIIEGNQNAQAHYWTTPAADKPAMHAYADTIHYYPARHLIELIGHARVEQANNSFSAPKIKYDTQAQHVVSQAAGNGRTTIIFHPEKHT